MEFGMQSRQACATAGPLDANPARMTAATMDFLNILALVRKDYHLTINSNMTNRRHPSKLDQTPSQNSVTVYYLQKQIEGYRLLLRQAQDDARPAGSRTGRASW